MRRTGGAPPDEPGLFRELLKELDIGVALSSPDGTLLYANFRFEELLGVRPPSLGRKLSEILSPRSWPDLEAALREARSWKGSQGDVTVKWSDRTTRTVRLVFRPLQHGKIRITASEVTELIQASHERDVSQASLRSLSARILQVEDDERRRLARDLHDNTGQEIAALSLALHQAETLSSNVSAETHEAVSQAIGFASRIEAQIRTLSYVLHPPLLDEFGLRAAIGWFVDGFAARSGIDLQLKVPKSLPRFSRRQEIVLFRVVQGAIANVLRHSGSRKARISVNLRPGAVQLAVEDEGKGMTEKQLRAVREGSGAGIGISGMHERLRELGGDLEVHSNKNGTQVIATLPLDREDIASEADVSSSPQSYVSPTPLPANVAAGSGNGARARILIADDHEIAREGIKTLLSSNPDLEVVGEARDGEEAIAKSEELKPDLLILDLSMPRIGGLAAATRIRQCPGGPKILIFTTHSFGGLAHALQAAGCQGYVLKEHAGTDLVNGIQQVLHGNSFYCPA